jgi:plasmid stability protein
MPSVLIRNLDDDTVERLKERARQNRRSLQGEAKSILESAVRPSKTRGKRRRRQPLEIHVVNVASRATYSRDEIYGDDGR